MIMFKLKSIGDTIDFFLFSWNFLLKFV